MCQENYKLRIISQILEKTFSHILNSGTENGLDYVDWCGLSPDLIVTRDYFEKLKVAKQSEVNNLNTHEIDFESFWNTIESSINAICSVREANQIKNRLDRLINSDDYLQCEDDFHQLSKQELEMEMEWIRQINQTDDALSRLQDKLKICSDSRLNYALKLAISRLSGEVESLGVNDAILENLKSQSVEDQTRSLQQLLDQGCQASLAIVGLFIFHQNLSIREMVLDGLKQFKTQDLLSLLSLMEKNNSIEYRSAAEEIRKEFSVQGYL